MLDKIWIIKSSFHKRLENFRKGYQTIIIFLSDRNVYGMFQYTVSKNSGTYISVTTAERIASAY